MSYNYSKLRGRVVEKFGTQRAFAKQLDLSERSISRKLSGKVTWKQSEIVKACELLSINADEISAYSFAM